MRSTPWAEYNHQYSHEPENQSSTHRKLGSCYRAAVVLFSLRTARFHSGHSYPSARLNPARQKWRGKNSRNTLRKRPPTPSASRTLRKTLTNCWSLATALKQYVDKSNENTLSVDVIKKAEEIEKLAHTIREKMKGQ